VASDEWWEVRNLPFISMFMKMSVETNFFMLLYSLCRDICRGRRHMQREKKTCHFGPPNCVEDMTIMFERS
jgi:hypothetical protein